VALYQPFIDLIVLLKFKHLNGGCKHLMVAAKCWVVSTQIWVKYGQKPKCWVKNLI